MIKNSYARLALATLLFGTPGCEGFITPQTSAVVDETLLTIVRVAPNAPPLAATEVSFWIVRGQQREVEIQYLVEHGYNGKCLRLVIPAEAPLRHADGRIFEVGDSVRATVRVVDADLFLFEFEPAGVQFNPAHPAMLEIRYRWMARETGSTADPVDEATARRLRIWQQDLTGGTWSQVPSTRQDDVQEIRGPVRTFTRYALASD
jgi:hypothetical protein